MRSSTSWKRAATVGAILSLALALGAFDVGNAHADPITPSYTVTDLDPGGVGSYRWVTARDHGQPTVIGAYGESGKVYPFQMTEDTSLGRNVLDTMPVMPPGNLPGPTFDEHDLSGAAPVSNPVVEVTFALQNANGIVAATSVSTEGLPMHEYWNAAYFTSRNADGSWGPPTTMWTTHTIGLYPTGPFNFLAINDRNQVLGSMGSTSNTPGPGDAVLYDIDTRHLINLTNYLKSLPGSPYVNLRPLALDEQGRILIDAQMGGPYATSDPRFTRHDILLLTPAGVSSTPIDVPIPTPEPSSLAVLALAMGALAHRQWRARRVR